MQNCRLLETDRNQITITCTWCIFLSKYYYYEYSCYSQVSKYTCLWSRDLYSLTRRTKTLLIDTTYTLLFPNSRIKTQLIVTNRTLFQKNKKNSERLDRAITILQKQACYYSTYDIYISTLLDLIIDLINYYLLFSTQTTFLFSFIRRNDHSKLNRGISIITSNHISSTIN